MIVSPPEYALHDLRTAVQTWAEAGEQSGWLTTSLAAPLRQCATPTTQSLGVALDDKQQPLTVGFFGGTGVGKSSLLNRLAGQAVAKTGVERPTSLDVSVYLHDSLADERLPADLPLDRMRVARHQQSRWRQVVWVDMPDIDSTATANRDLVATWFPHLDVLIYVVSPERYRDDKAWRWLQSHGGAHAWLFVLNQADRAQSVQVDDFRRQLQRAGFESPWLLCTDCREPASARAADDFEQLIGLIESFGNQAHIEQLNQHAAHTRAAQLAAALTPALNALAQRSALDARRRHSRWRELERTLLDGLNWSLKQYAQGFIAQQGQPWRTPTQLQPTADGKPAEVFSPWDGWAQRLVSDALSECCVELAHAGYPVMTLHSEGAALLAALPDQVLRHAELSLRQALHRPGNAVQRALLRVTGFCSALLPTLALGWVAYVTVMTYRSQAEGATPAYLGVDFTLHSGLLVVVAWLLPWWLHRQLTPSAERAALRGLRQGVATALATFSVALDTHIDQLHDQAQRYQQEGERLRQRCLALAPPAARAPERSALARLWQGQIAGDS